jgi:hypothetical protein
MKRFIHLKELNQAGFDHLFMAVAFIVVIGVGGSYYFITTHAQSSTSTWTGGLELGDTSAGGKCMESQGESEGDYVSLDTCSKTNVAQKFIKLSNGTWNGNPEFTLRTYEAGSFQCLDDWQASTSIKQNWVRLYPCGTASFAGDFVWWGTDHQLKNRASGLCIDDYQSNPATKLDFYTCKSTGQTNQNWFEVSNTASAGATVTAPKTTAPTTAPTTTSTSSSNGSNDASSANSSATSSSAGGSTSTSSGTPVTSSSDFTALLNAVKASDPSFSCNSLSTTTDIKSCDSVFGQ